MPARGRARVPSDTKRATEHARETIVRERIEARGMSSESVLAAMRAVPRHRFLPEHIRHEFYEDHPVWTGHEQTISQRYVVALMS
ncbi:MAG: hypothetical protein P8R42_16830 [Candidatus Binatia bacterium]|nr:hypothetical protein [Candidatus Binatia bacterium]